jgi:NAD(P)-dependent dehydrogenase (short-subunit alcohol dehydrogenase family)
MKAEKTCVVTGANSGIGKALSLALAEHGARVIMVCRDSYRGERAKTEVIEQTGNRKVELYIMELSSQTAIRKGVHSLKQNYDRIDVLINNAGVLLFKKEQTEDGIETTFAVNYLAPFLLTNLLLELLIASGAGRIINVVSEGLTRERFDVTQLMSDKKYKPVLAYSQSKQAEILFTYHLADRLAGKRVTSNCFYPGLVKTNLGNPEKGFRKITHGIMTTVLRPLFTPLEESVKIGVFLALSKKAEGLNGKFLKPQKSKVTIQSTYDKEMSRKLWELSQKLTSLNDERIRQSR